MKGSTALATAVLVCAGATGLTACGEDDADKPYRGMSADRLAAEAVDATQDAESVRMQGTARTSADGASVTVDFRVDARDNCVGTVSGRGAKADVIQAEQKLYVRGNQAFWKNSLRGESGAGRAADALENRWVKTTADGPGGQGMCDKQMFLAAMDEDKSERRGMDKGSTTTVAGQEALVLTKERSGAEVLELYVATEGEPYILKAVSRGGDSPSVITFTDYGKAVKAVPPPADQVVDPASAA